MIAIVTDSTSYLTKKEAQDMGVRVVPVCYSVSGRMYNETYVDCNGDFFRLLRQNGEKYQTSQASVGIFMSAFEELIREGYDILCLTISSRLSGTYSSAVIAAREIGSPRIRVVDSLTTAGGLYMLLKEASSMPLSQMNLEEVALKLESLRGEIKIAFSVDDMAPLRKSGRLGIVRQSVGTILNVKPLLLLSEGSVVFIGNARGQAEQINQLVAQVPKEIKSAMIHFIGDYEMAKKSIGCRQTIKDCAGNTVKTARPGSRDPSRDRRDRRHMVAIINRAVCPLTNGQLSDRVILAVVLFCLRLCEKDGSKGSRAMKIAVVNGSLRHGSTWNCKKKKIARTAERIDSLPAPLFSRFLFAMMNGMMKKNTWNPYDRSHWETLGWLDGKKPF